MIYFSSDFHFNHRNITGPSVSDWSSGYRHYSSTEEMNQEILDNVNSTVGVHDTLYFLGDFAFGNKNEIPNLRNLIHCRTIHLLYGNHDKALKEKFKHCFTTVDYYTEFRYKRTLFCLLHYSMHVWNEHARGAIHLFGHSHGSLGPQVRKCEDVGVDVHPKPLSIDEVMEMMQNREIVKVDHHNKETNYG